jgi:Histidine kinase-like ATPase domain
VADRGFRDLQNSRMGRRAVADRASLSGIRKRIRAELAQAGADPSSSFDCLVAVTQACSHALFHGRSPSAGGYTPQIRWEIGNEKACFYVEEPPTRERRAMAAHPSRVSPRVSEGERERTAEGYELDLMRGLMDEVEIDVSESVTTLRLLKRL